MEGQGTASTPWLVGSSLRATSSRGEAKHLSRPFTSWPLRPSSCSRACRGFPVPHGKFTSRSFTLTTTAQASGSRGAASHLTVPWVLLRKQNSGSRSWSLGELEFCGVLLVSWSSVGFSVCLLSLWTLALICIWDYFWMRPLVVFHFSILGACSAKVFWSFTKD